MKVVGSSGVSKPDPFIFTHTVRQAGFEPNECVYIGDHPLNDIMGATRAGMTAVWLAGFHTDVTLPINAPVVQNLVDVIHALNL